VSRERRLSTLQQRVKWLLEHRIFLVGNLDLKKVVVAMKRDGLISKSTYWPDCKSGIEEAAKLAKLHWYAEHNGREIRP
jgi:hypothetical protein